MKDYIKSGMPYYKRMLTIAVPIMVQSGITNFVSMIDNIMVGRVGTLQMTGVSIVNQIMMVFNLCIFGAMSGAGIFTSQFFGKKDSDGVRSTIQYKIIAAFLLSAFFVITLGTPVEVLELSVYRLKGMIVGYVAVLIAVFYWFGSVSKNRIPMWLQIALPASLPVIYISAEIVANLVMCLNLGFSLGIILISLITLPVSLFVCKKRKSPVNLSK